MSFAIASFQSERSRSLAGSRVRYPFRKLLIIDDDARYRRALKAFVELYCAAEPDWFQAIDEASDGIQGLDFALEHQPDLTLLDLEFPSNPKLGLDILYRLRESTYSGKVAIISGHGDAQFIFQAMRIGACGYLLKDKVAAQLPDAIACWVNDRIYLSPEVATRFFTLFRSPNPATIDIESLTVRERDVLQLLVEGASNQVIARQLYVTTGTVKAHLTSIFIKLKVGSRTQAIVKAVKLGLVSLDGLDKRPAQGELRSALG